MRTFQFLSRLTLSAALAATFTVSVLNCPISLEAQAISGDLLGVVTDSSGAVVPNATVDATNIATGVKASVKTNTNGEYRFVNLPVGHYSLAATGNGLSGGYKDVEVQLNKSATANISASIGSQNVTVEVSESAAIIDTTTSQIQTTFTEKQVQDLPTASVGSGVLNLSLLNAGVATSGGIGAGAGPSISGQRPRNNNFTIEGVDDNSKSVTGPLITIPNDAVGQFTVLQNQFSPEFGHSSGGQFNTLVKSGTNTFHGRVYDYLQNRNLDALDAQQKIAGLTSQPRFDDNRYGGQIGGPIVRNKLFFFQNFEYNPIGQSQTGFYCAPTASAYAFLAAQPGVSQTNLGVAQKYLGTASAAGGSSGCDPAVPFLTTGNNPKSQTGTYQSGQVNTSGPVFSNSFQYTTAIDLNLSQSDQIRGRYSYIKFDALDTAASLPIFFIGNPARFHLATLAEYHTFSPTITNEFRFGYNRFASATAVPNIKFPGLSVFPNLTFFDLQGVNVGPDGNAPQSTIQNLYQFTDNLTWVKGKHNLKFGFEGRKYISPQQFTQRARGDYQWGSFSSYLLDQSPITGADFGERSTGNPVYPGDQRALYGFGNDEWRITPQLSLNFGLRYEFTQVPFGNTLQALNNVSSVPGLISFNKPTEQKKNFAPRLGFAYSPGNSGDTSIRGGFALSTDVLYDNLGILSLPPQFNGTCDVGNPQSSTCFYSNTAFLASGGLPQTSGGFVTFPTAAAARSATTSFVPNQKLPYSESWNLGVQHIFAKQYTVEVRYVGTRGIHLPVQARLNRQSEVSPSLFLPTYVTAPSQATLDASTTNLAQINAVGSFVPSFAAAGFNANSIVGFQPYGQSVYHGLQTQINRSFSHGLQFQGAWTWSHAIDNSTADVFSTVLTPRRAQDWNNFANDYTTSALDRRHRVTLEVLYNLPFFAHSNWFAKNLLGNWEVAPIYTFQSPEYVTVQSGNDTNGNGDSAGDRTVINPKGNKSLGSTVTALCTSALPSGTACGSGASAPFLVGYVANNPNAYYIASKKGALANAARNTLSTPHTNNVDMTAVKRLNITERFAFEFQAQAFNVFNHSQYVPGSLNDIRSFGITSASATNYVRANNALFANPKLAFSNNPRVLQLVAKIIF